MYYAKQFEQEAVRYPALDADRKCNAFINTLPDNLKYAGRFTYSNARMNGTEPTIQRIVTSLLALMPEGQIANRPFLSVSPGHDVQATTAYTPPQQREYRRDTSYGRPQHSRWDSRPQ